jgi:hypothetical protein
VQELGPFNLTTAIHVHNLEDLFSFLLGNTLTHGHEDIEEFVGINASTAICVELPSNDSALKEGIEST